MKRRSKTFIVFTQTILHRENPTDSFRKLLEVISEFSKVTAYKKNTQKSFALLCTINETSGREIKVSIPVTIATKRIKCQGKNPAKET